MTIIMTDNLIHGFITKLASNIYKDACTLDVINVRIDYSPLSEYRKYIVYGLKDIPVLSECKYKPAIRFIGDEIYSELKMNSFGKYKDDILDHIIKNNVEEIMDILYNIELDSVVLPNIKKAEIYSHEIFNENGITLRDIICMITKIHADTMIRGHGYKYLNVCIDNIEFTSDTAIISVDIS